MEFVWDPVKRKKVIAEHNVDFEKIEDIFNDHSQLNLSMNLIQMTNFDSA
jgi:uncharacterized DUF497 family protein